MSPLLPLLLALAAPSAALSSPEATDGGAPEAAAIELSPPVATAAAPADGGEAGLGPMPTVTAVHADTAPKADGELDDAVWKSAPVYTLATQQQPQPGKPATVRTEVQFAYDAKNLYVAIRCFDPEPNLILNRMTRRDRTIENDNVTLEIDSRGDHKRAYVFELYPSGVQADALRTGDNAFDFDFDAVWSSGSRLTPQGWNAEYAIPLSTFRFSSAQDVVFRVEVSRYVSHKGESDQLVHQPVSEQGALLRMASLVGMRDLKPGEGIELRPFITGRLDHHYSPGPDFDSSIPPTNTHAGLGVGGDFAWHPTSELTLDGTVLPDFGQVEADQAVLNLSTFETFFPEKRPFFLSGADLFTLHDNLGNPLNNTQLFYSRRVGRPPLTPNLGPGQTLLEQPLTNDIWGALKLTGRVTDRVTIALLDAVSRREYAQLQGADGKEFLVPVSPLSNFGVGRLRVELPGGFSVGAMATSVLRRDRLLANDDLCPGGDDTPKNGRCKADAVTGGVDGTWTSSNGKYVAGLIVLGSHRSGGPDKTYPDGTVIHSGDSGAGALAQFSKASGSWTWFTNYEGYSPKLDLNEAGYLRQQNVHRLQGGVDYRTLEPWRATLRTDSQIYAEGRESTDGTNVGRHLQISESIQWKNYWGNYIELDLDPSYDDNRELRDGSKYERALTYGLVLAGHSDSRKKFFFGGFMYLGTTRHGYNLSSDVTFTLRPIERLDLALTPHVDWSDGDPRWFDTGGVDTALDALNTAHTYYLGDLDARFTSLTLRGTYSFSPKLTLQAYAQASVTTGHYTQLYAVDRGAGRSYVRLADLRPISSLPGDIDNPDFKDASLNVNIVLRWEYRPGSLLYLVYTRGQQIGPLTEGLHPDRPDFRALGKGPSDDTLLVKLSYYYGT